MRGRARWAAVAVVAAALIAAPLVAAPDPASAREWMYCANVRLTVVARVTGEDLAQCLGFRMGYASDYRTRIAATGDAATVADVRLDPLEIRARRGSERVRVRSAVSRDDSLLATFVRHAAPPDQLVSVARSVAWWKVVSATRAEDADGRFHPVWRFEPVERIRFDDSAARSVSLHLASDFLPVRFRASTTAVGLSVTYTQRWSQWGARVYAVCDGCRDG